MCQKTGCCRVAITVVISVWTQIFTPDGAMNKRVRCGIECYESIQAIKSRRIDGIILPTEKIKSVTSLAYLLVSRTICYMIGNSITKMLRQNENE